MNSFIWIDMTIVEKHIPVIAFERVVAETLNLVRNSNRACSFESSLSSRNLEKTSTISDSGTIGESGPVSRSLTCPGHAGLGKTAGASGTSGTPGVSGPSAEASWAGWCFCRLGEDGWDVVVLRLGILQQIQLDVVRINHGLCGLCGLAGWVELI